MKIVIGREICLGTWEWAKRQRICPVCTSEVADDAPTITCPHCGTVGHRHCLENWLSIRNSCPICKRPMLEVMA